MNIFELIVYLLNWYLKVICIMGFIIFYYDWNIIYRCKCKKRKIDIVNKLIKIGWIFFKVWRIVLEYVCLLFIVKKNIIFFYWLVYFFVSMCLDFVYYLFLSVIESFLFVFN